MELGNGLVAACASFASGALITGLGWSALNIAMLPLLAIALLMLTLQNRPQPAYRLRRRYCPGETPNRRRKARPKLAASG